jgi:hypothetical protein
MSNAIKKSNNNMIKSQKDNKSNIPSNFENVLSDIAWEIIACVCDRI